jgi:hypothetical protein
MMSCFRAPHSRPQGGTSLNDVDRAVLAAAIAEAHRVGHARAAHVLPGHICRRLLQELGPRPWEALPVNAGLVHRSRAVSCSTRRGQPRRWRRSPVSRRGRRRSHRAPLTVNEATFMAYDWPDGGISPHRDRARYRGAVIVFTVEAPHSSASTTAVTSKTSSNHGSPHRAIWSCSGRRPQAVSRAGPCTLSDLRFVERACRCRFVLTPHASRSSQARPAENVTKHRLPTPAGRQERTTAARTLLCRSRPLVVVIRPAARKAERSRSGGRTSHSSTALVESLAGRGLGLK